MTIDVRFHSIDHWPYSDTPARKGGQFRADFNSTLALLEQELDHLGGTDVVIECFLTRSEIRLDGWPRGDARRPVHPGVAVHFDTKDHGHLRYASDAYHEWKHNLRAIALGLEALRAVDRYGITRGGEQYRGFAQLPPAGGAIALGAGMSPEDAAAIIARAADYGGSVREFLSEDPEQQASAYRQAAKRLHPDKGGDAAEFQRLQDARMILEALRS